jgi:hypothetical protein
MKNKGHFHLPVMRIPVMRIPVMRILVMLTQ